MNPGRVEAEGNTQVEDLESRFCPFHPGQGKSFFIQNVYRTRMDCQDSIEGFYGGFVFFKGK